MAPKVTKDGDTYLHARGVRQTSAKALNGALRLALKTMPVTRYAKTHKELTTAEQAVLRRGGLVLEEQPGPDPLAETAAKFAALISSSLTTSEAGKRLGQRPGRIRQMIAERRLYSILLEGRRYIPIFQFLEDGHHLVPTIGRVNASLDPELHPVEVFNWYIRPNPDLFVDEDIEKTVSPLDGLKAGLPVEVVVRLARQL